MEYPQPSPQFPLMNSGILRKKPDRDDDIAEECRNLIRVLSYTIDSLSCEGMTNDLKLRRIRSLISSLSTLNSVLNDDNSISGPDYVEDGNGTRYFSVRNCELERFSAK